MFKKKLAHPLTQGLAIDDSRTTQLRRRIIREKSFLRRIYEEWYIAIDSALPLGKGSVLEIGSGAGFLKDIFPEVITSEVFFCPDVDMVMDGSRIPFADRMLHGIVMTDVFHHLPQPRDFLKEATRCVRQGGVLVMIEPWVTPWSRFVYSKLHHEAFLPNVKEWEFSSDGPVSGANSALPWIVFERDRKQFEAEFPQWSIRTIKLIMPFRYIASGGVSLRNFQPEWSYGVWRTLEYVLRPLMSWLAMFALIVVDKVD